MTICNSSRLIHPASMVQPRNVRPPRKRKPVKDMPAAEEETETETEVEDEENELFRTSTLGKSAAWVDEISNIQVSLLMG